VTPQLVDVTTRRPIDQRRRAWAPWFGVGVLLVLLATVVALHSPWVSVRHIEISGAERVEAAGLLEEAGIGTGAIMIWLDTTGVEEAIAADPWVGSVQAERVWPDRLVVDVDERVPALWVEGPAGWMLVAEDGVILEIASEPGEGLLRASIGMHGFLSVGSRPDDAVWDELVSLSGVLAAPLASASRLVSEDDEIWLNAPGHRVRLGHPIDLADKGRVLQVMLADGLPVGSMLDVVAPRRPAVVPLSAIEGLQAELEGEDGVDPAPAVEGEGGGA